MRASRTMHQVPAYPAPRIGGAEPMDKRYRRWDSPARRSLLAALPIMTCMILPLVQLGGAIYLYDVALLVSMAVLGFPRASAPGKRLFEKTWSLLVGAILVGFLSSLVRAGFGFRMLAYSGQFTLSLFYCLSLVLNLVSGRVNLRRFVDWIVHAGLVMAGFGILQFLLLMTAPGLADKLYSAYLEFSTFSARMYEQHYLVGIEMSGVARVVGTWAVPTTFGGMLVLSSAWLLVSRMDLMQKNIYFSIMALAVLLTQSRHAWAICFLVFLLLNRRSRIHVVVALVVAILGIIMIESMDPTYGLTGTGLLEQIKRRIDRTVDQGYEDSSIQVRYVEGTRRFVQYAARDPTMLLFGFGIQTDATLAETVGREYFYSVEWLDNYTYGYVSNGWLLIWRNCGLLGFIALVAWHWNLLRLRVGGVFGIVAVTALIFVSDNYSIHAPRCFFLLFVFLSTVWALSLCTLKEYVDRRSWSTP